MLSSVPIAIVLGANDGLDDFATGAVTDGIAPDVLIASACDVLMRCVALGQQLVLVCGPEEWVGWPRLWQLGIPTRQGISPRQMLDGTSMGLLLAADAPTVPHGYLETALDLLAQGACATLHGPMCAGGVYLRGWSTGTGHVTLPAWHRLRDADGLLHTRRDILWGCAAPRTDALVHGDTPEIARAHQRLMDGEYRCMPTALAGTRHAWSIRRGETIW